jgi:hypothetical protein
VFLIPGFPPSEIPKGAGFKHGKEQEKGCSNGTASSFFSFVSFFEQKGNP